MRLSLNALTDRVSKLGARFAGRIGKQPFLTSGGWMEYNMWELVDLAGWCFESEGNQAIVISEELAAVQFYHRYERIS